MSDFTGERLIPGEVDADLWNEHISRYFFAASLVTKGEQVLDAGCGTGYGASLLNRRSAAAVLGIDLSPHAITHASREYAAAGAQFAIGRCEALPVSDGSVGLITAFEVIEHLEGWREFLVESRRALKPGGLLLVSTPNRAVYAESRGDAGPNPFHVHEFDFDEFAHELAAVFPFVRIFGQNHTGTITLTALGEAAIVAERESLHVAPENAGYLVAVCSQAELPAIANFVFVPEAANTLLERDRHIRLLTQEVTVANEEFAALLERHRAQIKELERSNEWAGSLNTQLQDAGSRLLELQAELTKSNQWAQQLDDRLKDAGARIGALQTEVTNSNAWAAELTLRLERSELRVMELQSEVASQSAWAQSLGDELEQSSSRVRQLQAEVEEKNEWAAALSRESDARGARVLAVQQELEERTQWAIALNERVREFEASRWVRAGKTLRVGPLAK